MDSASEVFLFLTWQIRSSSAIGVDRKAKVPRRRVSATELAPRERPLLRRNICFFSKAISHDSLVDDPVSHSYYFKYFSICKFKIIER